MLNPIDPALALNKQEKQCPTCRTPFRPIDQCVPLVDAQKAFDTKKADKSAPACRVTDHSVFGTKIQKVAATIQEERAKDPYPE